MKNIEKAHFPKALKQADITPVYIYKKKQPKRQRKLQIYKHCTSIVEKFWTMRLRPNLQKY